VVIVVVVAVALGFGDFSIELYHGCLNFVGSLLCSNNLPYSIDIFCIIIALVECVFISKNNCV